MTAVPGDRKDWTWVLQRPRMDVWSSLEYACHVRDVHAVYDGRLRLVLATDDPLYPDWDQDATALASDYPGQDPAAVAEQLRTSGLSLADRFAGGTDWDRSCRRSDGASFTVRSCAQYLLHDVEHHLWDVRAAL